MPKSNDQKNRLSLVRKLENLYAQDGSRVSLNAVDLNKLVDQSKTKYKKQLNVTPRATGALPAGLYLPNQANLDYFIPVQSKSKYDKLIRRLDNHSGFRASPLNVRGSGYHVFTHHSTAQQPVPVSIALATGPSADAYLRAIRSTDPARKRLQSQKRQILKHAPYRKDRRLRSKTGAILDLADPNEQKKFLDYLKRDDVYGHRTQRADTLLEEQRLYGALEALKRGKLQGYLKDYRKEPANTAARRLSDADVKMLSIELMRDTPNRGLVQDMADKYKVDENTIKREFLKAQLINTSKAPEKSKTAPAPTPAVFINRIDRPLSPDSAQLRNSYVVVPREAIQRLDKRNPAVRFIENERIPRKVKEALLTQLVRIRAIAEIKNRRLTAAMARDPYVRKV